jgi:hypothetical protein
MAGAAYAFIAVLGYWVLLQAVKETSNCIKRIGDVLGSILVVVGLLGLLCAVASHVKTAMHRCCCGGQGPAAAMTAPVSPQDMGEMPPGHPPVSGKTQEEPGGKKGGKKK